MIVDLVIVLIIVGFVVFVVDRLAGTIIAPPYPLIIKGIIIVATTIWLLNKYARPYLP